MDDDVRGGDPLEELSFALAEGAAEPVTDEVRARVVQAALAARRAGRPVRAPKRSPAWKRSGAPSVKWTPCSPL